MSKLSKNMILGSMLVAAVVGLASIVDMAIGKPFSRQPLMDIMFLISAGIMGYMGFEAYRELS